MTSVPSRKVTPATTLGNWLSQFNRREVFAAAKTSLNTMSRAVVGDSDPLVRTVLCRTVANTLSVGFVTGMRMTGPMFGRDTGSGVWCDHPGQRHREHEGAGRPVHTMSCELVLVAGRLCDSPGCAESADP